MRIFGILSPFRNGKTTFKQQLNGEQLDVGYLSAFGWAAFVVLKKKRKKKKGVGGEGGGGQGGGGYPENSYVVFWHKI